MVGLLWIPPPQLSPTSSMCVLMRICVFMCVKCVCIYYMHMFYVFVSVWCVLMFCVLVLLRSLVKSYGFSKYCQILKISLQIRFSIQYSLVFSLGSFYYLTYLSVQIFSQMLQHWGSLSTCYLSVQIFSQIMQHWSSLTTATATQVNSSSFRTGPLLIEDMGIFYLFI